MLIQTAGSKILSIISGMKVMMMIQIQDSAERVYQAHGIIDLQEVKDDVGKSNRKRPPIRQELLLSGMASRCDELGLGPLKKPRR